MARIGPHLVAAAVALPFLVGCNNDAAETDTVAEGVIYYVSYTLPEGGTGGFTRLNSASAVPGGNGSWNVDAHGRLTREFLFITWPPHLGLEEQVIPADRILDIQFGTGGIENIGGNGPPAP